MSVASTRVALGWYVCTLQSTTCGEERGQEKDLPQTLANPFADQLEAWKENAHVRSGETPKNGNNAVRLGEAVYSAPAAIRMHALLRLLSAKRIGLFRGDAVMRKNSQPIYC